MPKKTGPMDERQRGICRRIGILRRELRWSQASFARLCGLSRDQLAGIEYRRTPLSFRAGMAICRVFGASPHWVLTGEGEIRGFPPQLWSADELRQFKETDLLSEVYDRFPGHFTIVRDALDILHKATPGFDPKLYLLRALLAWFEGPALASPLAQETFVRALANFAENFLNELSDLDLISGAANRIRQVLDSMPGASPGDPRHRKAAVKAAVDYLKLRAEARSSSPDLRKELPNVSESVNNAGVKLTLENLLARLHRATKARGQKTELAAYLGVPLASVSQWLSGEREPGGETTLRLLRWVEQQEAK